jgi:aminoglycoside phosphotransferase (APT) family kinase protein
MRLELPELERVRSALGGWCDGEIDLDGLRIKHVKPSATGTMRALYEAPGPGGQVLRLAARWAGPGEGAKLAADINGGRPPVAGFVAPAHYASSLGWLFQAFPADLKLPSLPTATSASAMAPVLERAFGGALRSIGVDVLRYKPERKCLLRYRLEWEGAGPQIVYGRVSRRRDFERSHDTLRRIRAASSGEGFALPEALGVVADLDMELFSHLAGEPLFTLVDRPDFPALCAGTGAALHDFHETPATVGSVLDRGTDLAKLAENAGDFAWLLPGERARIDALHRRLIVALEASAPAEGRLVHGDFHGDNVLVDGERLGLIDFEDCALGDAAEDVALNWVQLNWYAVKAGDADSTAARGRDAFLKAYLARADAATARRMPLRVALQCFYNAYQCARRPQDPERFEDMEIMLRACGDALEGSLT